MDIPDLPDFLRRKLWQQIDAKEKLKEVLFPTPAEPLQKKVVVEKSDRPHVQDHIREKASGIIGELEGMIDDGVIKPGWSLYDYLRKNDYKSAIAQRIKDHFTPRANEILEVMADPDNADLQEGYRQYSKTEIEHLAMVYQSLVDDGERFQVNAKLLEKKRGKSNPKAERIIKNLPYLSRDETYKLVSIDPVKVVGALELWTFNPTNCVVTVYRALDRGGLSFQGSNVTNVNEKASLAKRIGRKTEQRLDDIRNGGKVVLRKFMDNVRGDALKITRITKKTILLRAV